MTRWWNWGTSPNVETGPSAGGGFHAGRADGAGRVMMIETMDDLITTTKAATRTP